MNTTDRHQEHTLESDPCKDEWIKLAEASERTGYSVSTLRRLVRLRKLNGHRHSRDWLVNWSSFQSYIQAVSQGRKINRPTPLKPQGLKLWLPRSRSKSPKGLNILVNGQQIHLLHLNLEYPRHPDDVINNLAPGLPGFYTISVRGMVSTILWLEQQFTTGAFTLTILKPGFPTVHYTQPVESVCETMATNQGHYLSAAYGFYKAEVTDQLSETEKHFQISGRI